MRNLIQEILDEKGIVILDGAMATELEKKGCNLNHELWSAIVLSDQPELIEAVHYDYYAAGADVGISASYQATIDGFTANGYAEEQAEMLIKNSVVIMQAAREKYQKQTDKKLAVAGSCGPYGAYLADGSEYVGDYNIGKEELKAFHRRRMELLLEAGADVLAVETVPCLEEAEAAVEVAEELGALCWISFSCKNETEISDGTDIAVCGSYLKEKENVAAIGINCTAPEYVSSLIEALKAGSDNKKPIIVYPNTGEEYDPVNKVWNGASDGKSYGQRAKEWYEAGARIIGGCCRTSPDDIRQVAAYLEK